MASRHIAAFAAVAGLAVAVAGCGDNEGAATLQEAVPAEAVMYVEAVVHPEDDIRDDLDEMFDRFGAQSPGPLIVDQLNDSLQEDGSERSFEEDIEPWLGERAGLYLVPSAFGSDSSDALEHGAVMLQTTDGEAASKFIQQSIEEDGDEFTEGSYEDYDYSVDPDGTAGGIVGDLLVIGSEQTFQDVVDTIEGGDGLAEDEAFADALEDSDEALASLYVDVERAIDETGARTGPGSASVEQFEALAPDLLSEPVVASLELDDQDVALEVNTGSFGPLAASFGATGATAITGAVPESAWGATSSDDLGPTYLETLEQVTGTEAFEESEFQLFERQVQEFTGLSVDEAFGSVGDVSVFISGGSVPELGGGAIIEVLDEAAADRLFDSLERTLATEPGARVQALGVPGREGFSVAVPDLPQPVNFIRDDGRWVIAIGQTATEEALEPAGTLGDTPAFQAAAEAMDDEVPVNTFLEVAPVLELLTNSPVGLSGDYVAARPYLEHLEFISYGAYDDGETSRFKFVVGTK